MISLPIPDTSVRPVFVIQWGKPFPSTVMKAVQDNHYRAVAHALKLDGEMDIQRWVSLIPAEYNIEMQKVFIRNGVDVPGATQAIQAIANERIPITTAIKSSVPSMLPGLADIIVAYADADRGNEQVR